MTEEDIALAALVLVGVPCRQRRALAAHFGDGAAWWPRRGELASVLGSTRAAAELAETDLEARAVAALEAAQARGYRLVSAGGIAALGGLPEPPAAVFVRGELPGEGAPRLAVVGARQATGYGLQMARRLAAGAAHAGVWVISGLARGVDAAAHEGALSVGGPTLAVLGSGPDRPYPPEHAPLAQRIGEGGCVLTEYAPGVPPRPHNFPRRNRILVGLADAVLVIEARLKSGTLTSVRWALDLGREVLVLPGRVDSPVAEGPLELLREGATPVGTVGHVLEALGLGEVSRGGLERATASGLDAISQRLLALLGSGPMGLDELVRSALEPPGQVLTTMLSLEARGLVRRGVDQRFEGSALPEGRAGEQPAE